jgi:hypothetical protein
MFEREKRVAIGMLTLVPGLHELLHRGTGGTNSARYCYSVWLRHIKMAAAAGLDTNPGVVAELGPGDSIGIGLCALLTGASRYVALDAVPHANRERNIAVFDELSGLFRGRSAIPDDKEFPHVRPAIRECSFPDEVYGADLLEQCLADKRIQQIRTEIEKGGEFVRYISPWDRAEVLEAGSVDLLISQAVLEHIDDLELVYSAMARWLRAGGYVSHQIDFSSHGTARHWNGQLGYSDFTWRLMRGRLPYLLNRRVFSDHRQMLTRAGFQIVNEVLDLQMQGIERADLAPRFRNLCDEDLRIAGALLQARRIA